MKDIVIIGAGGFAREVAWLIEEINNRNREWNILGFVEDNKENIGKYLNNYQILGTVDYLNNLSNDIYVVIAIGNGKIRENIANRIQNKRFATLIHPNISVSETNIIGEGSIICSGSILTVNIILGKNIIVNLDCTIGHDAIIEDFCTILPSVNLSGKTKIKKYTTLGTGAKIIQGIEIGENVMVGAGAVIIRNVENNCTVVGNPGKVIKKGE